MATDVVTERVRHGLVHGAPTLASQTRSSATTTLALRCARSILSTRLTRCSSRSAGTAGAKEALLGRRLIST
jgi:hypothetical protein